MKLTLVLLLAFVIAFCHSELLLEKNHHLSHVYNLYKDEVKNEYVYELKPEMDVRDRIKLIESRREDHIPLEERKEFFLKKDPKNDAGEGGFQMIPSFKTAVRPGMVDVEFTTNCYSYNATITIDSNRNPNAVLTITSGNKKGFECIDELLIADQEHLYFMTVTKNGDHQLTFQNIGELELTDLAVNGMNIFLFQDGIKGTIVDIIDTLGLFYGNWTDEIGLEFVKDYMNITYEPRNEGYIQLPFSDLRSGDYLATQRFDGSEVMIQYGTGATSGHSTIVVELNNTLHVCESTGKNTPDYWPAPYGIICHEYNEWMQLAQNANYMVTVMRLNDELRAKWDNAKVEEFIYKELGNNYGFWNFLFGWIDAGQGNMPYPLSTEFFAVLASLLDRINPEMADRFYLQALSHRLGNTCNTMDCIWETLYKTGMSFDQLINIPENDKWLYSNNGLFLQRSMVCNVFVANVMRAAGIFDPIGEFINIAEQTPRDLYTMNIWNSTTPISNLCPSRSDGLNVCQIMGDYISIFKDWNTITPYTHMAERCSGLPMDYYRPPHC